MNITFEGKRCLVTGAGKGIGRGCVEALVRGGAHVFALSRTKADLDSLEEELGKEERGHLITSICVDLSDWPATKEAVQRCLPIELLVNNAGIGRLNSFFDVTPQVIDETMNTNLKSMVNVSQVVLKRMVTDNIKGSVVNVSSQASLVGLLNHSAYSASKGAMDSVTRVMANEFGPKGIRVNAVNPTVIMTDLSKTFWLPNPEKCEAMLSRIPLGRFGQVEDVVSPILFLLSDGAKMIHGACIPIEGGVTSALSGV